MEVCSGYKIFLFFNASLPWKSSHTLCLLVLHLFSFNKWKEMKLKQVHVTPGEELWLQIWWESCSNCGLKWVLWPICTRLSDVQPPVIWVMVGELHANRQGLLQVLRESSAWPWGQKWTPSLHTPMTWCGWGSPNKEFSSSLTPARHPAIELTFPLYQNTVMDPTGEGLSPKTAPTPASDASHKSRLSPVLPSPS